MYTLDPLEIFTSDYLLFVLTPRAKFEMLTKRHIFTASAARDAAFATLADAAAVLRAVSTAIFVVLDAVFTDRAVVFTVLPVVFIFRPLVLIVFLEPLSPRVLRNMDNYSK
jgi:hypothetical protein